MVTTPTMGNNSSHKKTRLPKQPLKERLPNMDKAQPKMQFFSNLKQKQPRAKVVLLFPRGKAEVSAGSGAQQPEGRGEDEADTPTPECSQAVAPMLRGAGDGSGRRDSARAREMRKILVLLLLLDAPEEERPAGGAAKGVRGWQRLYARLLNLGSADPGEQPRKRRRPPRAKH